MLSTGLLKIVQTTVQDVLKKRFPDLTVNQAASVAEYVNTADRGFGDIQLKGLIAVSKLQKVAISELSGEVSQRLGTLDFVEKAVQEGPGYVNLFIKNTWLCERIRDLLDYERKMKEILKMSPKTVVIDYSSPNMAKELHAGHLRSTIIGDCLARLFELVGSKVIRQSHVGDWGTQFGMMIAYIKTYPETKYSELSDLDNIYVLAKKKFDSCPEFADLARTSVAHLQSGNHPEVNECWKRIIDISLEHCSEIYNLLDVKLTREDVRGESTYNHMIPDVIKKLEEQGLLITDDGAKVVLTPNLQSYFKGAPVFILQKKNGGYGYAMTDLATAQYRSQVLKADRVIYVVDVRQRLHLAQVFDVSRRAGLVRDEVSLEHVEFGMILGSDKKPFKSRTGGNLKLISLINEVLEHSYNIAKEKNETRPDGQKLDEEQLKHIAHVVGIGALKYVDLSKNRTKDYVLDLKLIFNFEGDTAPYIMYSYTRANSIVRLVGINNLSYESLKVLNVQAFESLMPREHELSVSIIQFPEVIRESTVKCTPRLICAHMYRISSIFARFYEECPISKCNDEKRDFRIALCALTAQSLKLGLETLGIGCLEVM